MVAARRCDSSQWWRRGAVSLSLSILSAERSQHLYPSRDEKLTWPHASFAAAWQLRLLLRQLLARSAWCAIHHDTWKRARFESHDAVYVISLPYIGARHTSHLDLAYSGRYIDQEGDRVLTISKTRTTSLGSGFYLNHRVQSALFGLPLGRMVGPVWAPARPSRGGSAIDRAVPGWWRRGMVDQILARWQCAVAVLAYP